MGSKDNNHEDCLLKLFDNLPSETKLHNIKTNDTIIKIVNNDKIYNDLKEFVNLKIQFHQGKICVYNVLFIILGLYNVFFNVFFIVQLFYKYLSSTYFIYFVILNLINSMIFMYINPGKQTEQHKMIYKLYEELMVQIQLETYKHIKEEITVFTKRILERFNEINSISLLF